MRWSRKDPGRFAPVWSADPYSAPAQPGAFRVTVTSADRHRCVVTGERPLPILDAAHIRPYEEGGEHDVTNGFYSEPTSIGYLTKGTSV